MSRNSHRRFSPPSALRERAGARVKSWDDTMCACWRDAHTLTLLQRERREDSQDTLGQPGRRFCVGLAFWYILAREIRGAREKREGSVTGIEYFHPVA